MALLVTGAAGAIGQHVVAVARSTGEAIYGIGHGSWPEDLIPLDAWMRSDLDEAGLNRFSQAHRTPSGIIHLAGGSLVGQSITNPDDDRLKTVRATADLVSWHKKHAPQAPIVFVSTAAVYGSGNGQLLSESSPTRPTSPYGVHKLEAETMLRAYATSHQAKICILRPFSVYGIGLRKQLIWDVASRALAGQDTITLGGTGAESRDFVYIEDAAQCVISAIGLASPLSPTFNLCTGVSTSIAEVAATLADFFGVDLRFGGEIRPGDPTVLVGDPSSAIAVGLRSRTTFLEGIVKTLEWITTDAATRA